MPQYQKAYLLKDLRRFPGWTETRLREEQTDRQAMARPGEPAGPQPEELTDESIVYIQEDLTVCESCFDTSSKMFDKVTPEWDKFCRNELGFAVPDWEEESRVVREALAQKESGSAENKDAPGSPTG